MVKTRLAADIGENRALKIYQYLTKLTLDTCAKVTARRSLYFYPQIDLKISHERNKFFTAYLQRGESLGDKMNQAFTEAFSRSDAILIIGSDCPYLTEDLMTKAFEMLHEDSEVVIGPASDGGYYLLGLRDHQPALFADIDWSTDKVYQQTVDKVKSLGLSLSCLPELSDIDYIDDWRQYLTIMGDTNLSEI